MQHEPQTDLILTRTLNLPRDIVWACWTQPEHIKQFFIPAPHRVTACTLDLKAGGRFNTTFEVDGSSIDNTGVFLEIVPQEKLVFTDAYTEGWKPAADPFMTAILTFADAGANQTAYTALARHRSAEARKAHEDMGFHDGWNTVADQLERYGQTLLQK